MVLRICTCLGMPQNARTERVRKRVPFGYPCQAPRITRIMECCRDILVMGTIRRGRGEDPSQDVSPDAVRSDCSSCGISLRFAHDATLPGAAPLPLLTVPLETCVEKSAPNQRDAGFSTSSLCRLAQFGVESVEKRCTSKCKLRFERCQGW